MEQGQLGRIGRRLAAIVAADVAGYSRLMGLDEVGTARTLREHRKVTDALVAKHGGRLVKTTGDGVLLEFPSVVDAVECAVAVQTVKQFAPIDAATNPMPTSVSTFTGSSAKPVLRGAQDASAPLGRSPWWPMGTQVVPDRRFTRYREPSRMMLS
jgi:hypothetical protein